MAWVLLVLLYRVSKIVLLHNTVLHTHTMHTTRTHTTHTSQHKVFRLKIGGVGVMIAWVSSFGWQYVFGMLILLSVVGFLVLLPPFNRFVDFLLTVWRLMHDIVRARHELARTNPH